LSLRERLATGLRVRIFVILVLILLPILGLVYVIEQEEERTLAQVVLDQVQSISAHLVTGYTDGVNDTRRLLANLARLPEIQTAGPGCRSALAWYRDTYPTYLNLGVIDRQGFVVCSALPTVGRVNLGDRLYFRQVIATRQFAVGEYQIGRITQKATVNFGYPLLDSAGDVRAVLFAAFDLAALSRGTSTSILPRGAVTTLVDREGVVLTRYPDPEHWTGRRLPEAAVLRAIQSHGQGIIETQGPDGIVRLYGVALLRNLPGAGTLYASVGIPTISAAAQQDELLIRDVAGLTLLGLMAAWLAFGVLFVKPIEALVAAAHRVGQGELSARSGVAHRKGELGQLSQAFDGMAEELQRREVERNASEQQILNQLQTLTALYASARQLTLSLDPDDLGRRIVRIFVEVFGGQGAWIGRAVPDGRLKWLAHYPIDATLFEEFTARWDESTGQGQGPSGRAIRSGFPVIVSDVAGDPTLASWRDLFHRYRIASLGSFPLTSRDETFGVLAVLSDDAAFFSAHRVELFSAFAHQAAAALENARLHEETTDRLDKFESLSKIDLAISSSLDLKIMLGVILDQVTARLRVDAADILLLRPPTQMLEYAAGRGFRETRMSGTRLRLGEEYAGRVASERRTFLIPDLRETQATSPQEAEATPERFLTYLITREQFVSYAAAPLIAKGHVLGVLEVYHRTALDPDPTWLAFLEAVAGQAAIAVDNATLFDNLQRSNRDLARAYDTTLEGWSRAMDLRDKETEGHTQRVTDLTVRLARAMGLREDQVVHLRRGALLHDIGKMGVPDAILFKPDKLTAEEWTQMRRHPEYARDFLQPVEYLRPALAVPYAHHEKWDGSGYPQGLRGDQIPLEARIFAVVDVWDALTSDRPYRPAWSREQALTYVREQSGKHFDPKVAEAFVSLMGAEPAGSTQGK
jgi:HD-GYP domain-containing protein (c-di-GMP phosphodiesterase class II)/HAMP domain-containing protein